MTEFDDIESLKWGQEKIDKFTQYYQEKVKIDDWLNNNFKKSIINFKDRTEYKKNNLYHRLNGPAIDYNNEKFDKYYYKGEEFKTKDEWQKATLRELRKIKIKKVNKSS
jgi:hypothetical protein